jgi:hypothetical protein
MIAVPCAGQDTRRPGEELGPDEPLQPTDVRNAASATTRNGEPARFTIERQDSTDLIELRRLISGGGGNRIDGDSPGFDDSRTVSRTGIDVNTSKEHEENALPDILMTMSQIPVPDVTRELAEVGAMFSVLRAMKGEARRS